MILYFNGLIFPSPPTYQIDLRLKNVDVMILPFRPADRNLEFRLLNHLIHDNARVVRYNPLFPPLLHIS
jgi:hypothetical protein